MGTFRDLLYLLKNLPYKQRYEEMMNKIQNNNLQNCSPNSSEDKYYRDRKPVKEILIEFFKEHPDKKVPAELEDIMNGDVSVEVETDKAEYPIKEIPSLYEVLEANAKENY